MKRVANLDELVTPHELMRERRGEWGRALRGGFLLAALSAALYLSLPMIKPWLAASSLGFLAQAPYVYAVGLPAAIAALWLGKVVLGVPLYRLELKKCRRLLSSEPDARIKRLLEERYDSTESEERAIASRVERDKKKAVRDGIRGTAAALAAICLYGFSQRFGDAIGEDPSSHLLLIFNGVLGFYAFGNLYDACSAALSVRMQRREAEELAELRRDLLAHRRALHADDEVLGGLTEHRDVESEGQITMTSSE